MLVFVCNTFWSPFHQPTLNRPNGKPFHITKKCQLVWPIFFLCQWKVLDKYTMLVFPVISSWFVWWNGPPTWYFLRLTSSLLTLFYFPYPLIWKVMFVYSFEPLYLTRLTFFLKKLKRTSVSVTDSIVTLVVMLVTFRLGNFSLIPSVWLCSMFIWFYIFLFLNLFIFSCWISLFFYFMEVSDLTLFAGVRTYCCS